MSWRPTRLGWTPRRQQSRPPCRPVAPSPPSPTRPSQSSIDARPARQTRALPPAPPSPLAPHPMRLPRAALRAAGKRLPGGPSYRCEAGGPRRTHVYRWPASLQGRLPGRLPGSRPCKLARGPRPIARGLSRLIAAYRPRLIAAYRRDQTRDPRRPAASGQRYAAYTYDAGLQRYAARRLQAALASRPPRRRAAASGRRRRMCEGVAASV